MRPLLLTLGLWLIPASVEAQQVQAFATDTIPSHLDSVVSRSRKDTTIQTLKQPKIIIWTTDYRNRQHLRDSLVVWCTKSCKWEWDGVVDMPDSGDVQLSVTPVWGVDSIHAPAVWAMGYTGQGVKVASLDSGIDPNHSYRVGGGYDASGQVFGGASSWTDNIPSCNGHGTHVGGTMADTTGRGVAKGATLYGIKVFSDVNGQCLAYTSAQIAGIEWAVANGIRAINVSIGGSNTSAAYQNAIASARNAGVVIGAANGNSGSTPALFPGRADYLLGVASVNQQLQRSGFSNYGPTTDLSGPGEGIESTLPGGGYGQKSGTSMATPHVVGAAALVMSAEPTLSADSVMSLLRLSALPLGAQPNDYTGYGLVRPDRAIALARGGVWVAGPVQDTVRVYGEKCYPMVAVRSYTVGVTAGVQWRQAGDSICVTLTEHTPRDIRITVLAATAPPVTMTLGDELTLTSGGAVYYAAVASGSTVHVVYSDVPQGTPVRYARSTDDGRTFSPPITLDGAGSVNLESPLAVDGAVVGVISVNPTQSFNDGFPRTGGEVLLRRSLDGGVTWGTASPITSGAKAFRVALDIAGPIWNATWMDYRNGRWDLFATRSTDNGATWTAPTVLVSGAGLLGNPGGPARPVFARDGSHLYLTWMDPRDNRGPCALGAGAGTIPNCTEVYVKHSPDLGATWEADRRLTTNPSGSYAGRSSLAAQGGLVLIVYDYSVPGGPLQIASVRSTDFGVSWSAPTILSSVNAGEQTHAVVSLAPSRAYVAWRATRNGATQVWGRFSTDGGVTWSAEQLWSSSASSIPVVANGTTLTLLYSAATYGPLYARRVVVQ